MATRTLDSINEDLTRGRRRATTALSTNLGAGKGFVLTYRCVVSLLATDLELNDEVEILTLPTGSILVGICGKVTDLDTHGTPTIVGKLQVGSTNVMLSISEGQLGGLLPAGEFRCNGLDMGGEVLKWVTTTAAATAQAGTLTLLISIAHGLTADISG